MRLRLAIVGAAAMAAVVASAAPASAHHLDGSLSASIGSPIQLINGVTLSVPVAVTCPAQFPEPFATLSTEELAVSVTQNVGRAFAQGSGGIFYQSGFPFGIQLGTPLTCDGTAHTYVVTVNPDVTGPPFHGGRAVASASFGITLVDPLNPWQQDSNFVLTGEQPASIRG